MCRKRRQIGKAQLARVGFLHLDDVGWLLSPHHLSHAVAVLRPHMAVGAQDQLARIAMALPTSYRLDIHAALYGQRDKHSSEISALLRQNSQKEGVTHPRFLCYTALQKAMKRQDKSGRSTAKKIVNIRLRPDQEAKIDALVRRSAILDTSKVVRIAVDWLLMSDIGEVLTKIVNPQAFPDYAVPKKRTVAKKRRRSSLK